MQNSYGFVKLCYGVVGSYKDTSNMTTDEVIEEFLKHEGVSSAEEYYDKSENNTYGKLKQEYLTNNTSGSIIKSGAISGARNPYGNKAKEHAKKYYDLVRSMKTDVSKIAQTTGFSKEQIQDVKNFIFYEKHDLGGEEPELFKPDFMMGESWKRLIDGNPEPHDITLINHEIMERDLINKGYTQDQAHKITSKKYDYAREAAKFYDKIKKYSD